MLRIATCQPLPEPDPDEAPLRAALAARGVPTRMVAWNDPQEDWSGGCTLIRSTWNYVHHVDAFAHWIDQVSGSGILWNPADLLRGNLHKGYLLQLAAHGVPVTPTVLIERGARRRLNAIAAERQWDDVVVKPAVGAGSFATHRLSDPASAQAAHTFDALLAERDVLVQPYLKSVENHGERALVFIDGQFTHAVRKSPRFAADSEQVSEALPIADDERVVGERALIVATQLAGVRTDQLLYGRVDVARDEFGRVVLMELELVEPSLFLLQSLPALDRFADAITRRVPSGAVSVPSRASPANDNQTP